MIFFLLSNLYFYTYFHLSPLLDHHFFGLWRGETAQYLSWKIGCAKKAKRPISHVIWDFSPVVWPFSDSRLINLYLIFEKSGLKNQVRWNGFLVYFKEDFYCRLKIQLVELYFSKIKNRWIGRENIHMSKSNLWLKMNVPLYMTMAIFSPYVCSAFTKLRFWQSFWGA